MLLSLQNPTKSVQKYFAVGLVSAGCLGSIIALQMSRLNETQDVSEQMNGQQLETQSTALVRQLRIAKDSPSLGFSNLIADWYFLGFLQYFGDTEARDKTDYQAAPEFFRVIIDKDPLFFPAYLFLSTSVSIYAAQPQTSAELAGEGLSHMTPQTPPESAIVWRYKGLDEFLFLKDFAIAQNSYQTAAQWAEQSPDPAVQATAPLSAQTAAFIADNPNSTQALIMGWTQVLTQAVNEDTFNLAVNQINALGGEVVMDDDGQFRIDFQNQEP
jgi:hypothetical protein